MLGAQILQIYKDVSCNCTFNAQGPKLAHILVEVRVRFGCLLDCVFEVRVRFGCLLDCVFEVGVRCGSLPDCVFEVGVRCGSLLDCVFEVGVRFSSSVVFLSKRLFRFVL